MTDHKLPGRCHRAHAGNAGAQVLGLPGTLDAGACGATTSRLRQPGLAAILALLFMAPIGCNVLPDSRPHVPSSSNSDDDGRYMRRLTHLELDRSLRYVLGPVVLDNVEPDLYRAGLARVGATEIVTSASSVERLDLIVERALDQVFANPEHRAAFIGCAEDIDGTDACVDDFILRVGQRAWRRPPAAAEIHRYAGLQKACAPHTESFAASMRCVADGILHSPYFLYRVELPTNGEYIGYDMASRLSYFLWSAPPDSELLAAAHRGDLDTADGVRAEAARMMESPLAREGLAVFVDEWFRLDQLDRLERDVLAETSEEIQFGLGRTGELQAWLSWMAFAAREELRQMIVKHVFDDNEDYLNLLITDRTYVDPHLEAFYELAPGGEDGAPPIGEERGDDYVVVDGPADGLGFARARHAPNSPRRGLLGTMAVLSQLGKQNETSPTRRGLYVMERFLCQELGDPPDDIDQCERPDGVSKRESIESHHVCIPTCAGCHNRMDPLGFALDNFDTLGRYRSHDDWGFPLDTAVSWTMVDPSGNKTLQFNDLRSMAETFYKQPQATSCVTRQIYRFATGREEEPDDEAMINELNDAFIADGRRLKSFMIHFTGTDAFRRAPVHQTQDAATLAGVANTIFARRCAPCHVGGQEGGLSLSNDATLGARLAAPSSGAPGMPLISPGDVGRSYLWHKVAGTHADVGGSGAAMPPNGALPADELERLRQWIAGGAK